MEGLVAFGLVGEMFSRVARKSKKKSDLFVLKR